MAVNDTVFINGESVLYQSSGETPETVFINGESVVVHQWAVSAGGIIPLIQHHRQQQGTA